MPFDWMPGSLKETIVLFLDDLPYLARLSGHLGLLTMITAVLLASQVRADFLFRPNEQQSVTDNVTNEIAVGGPELNEAYLIRITNPITTIPKRERREIVRYVVQPNDTVSGIAAKFEIKPETILWANAQLENDPDMLTVGETLMILPINGAYHTVAAGDTSESIAKKYKVDPSAILNYELNVLKPGEALTVGQRLVVPGGRKPIVQKFVRAYSGPIPETAARGTGNFGWPVSGVITQKYWTGHAGIDIGAPTGTPVQAADSGFVIFAGWDDKGFGKMILIDHGNSYLTLYGHLDVFAVVAGDSVKKGELIGRVGSTGRSTGPHLDFRIRENGVWRNPFGFLR